MQLLLPLWDGWAASDFLDAWVSLGWPWPQCPMDREVAAADCRGLRHLQRRGVPASLRCEPKLLQVSGGILLDLSLASAGVWPQQASPYFHEILPEEILQHEDIEKTLGLVIHQELGKRLGLSGGNFVGPSHANGSRDEINTGRRSVSVREVIFVETQMSGQKSRQATGDASRPTTEQTQAQGATQDVAFMTGQAKRLDISEKIKHVIISGHRDGVTQDLETGVGHFTTEQNAQSLEEGLYLPILEAHSDQRTGDQLLPLPADELARHHHKGKNNQTHQSTPHPEFLKGESENHVKALMEGVKRGDSREENAGLDTPSVPQGEGKRGDQIGEGSRVEKQAPQSESNQYFPSPSHAAVYQELLSHPLDSSFLRDSQQVNALVASWIQRQILERAIRPTWATIAWWDASWVVASGLVRTTLDEVGRRPSRATLAKAHSRLLAISRMWDATWGMGAIAEETSVRVVGERRLASGAVNLEGISLVPFDLEEVLRNPSQSNRVYVSATPDGIADEWDVLARWMVSGRCDTLTRDPVSDESIRALRSLSR